MDRGHASEVAALAEWIKDCFDRAKIECLELSQRVPELDAVGETNTISSWAADDFEGMDPKHLADAIVSDAFKDAETQRGRGTTRYQVLAFKDGEKRTRFAYHIFRLPGGRGAEPAMVILDHLAVSPTATLLGRMTRHAVGIFGCAAEAVERASSWVASGARTFSEGGDARYQRGD